MPDAQPRVFFPQVPSRFDTGVNLWVPKMDIQPAEKFGKPVVLMPPEASRLAAPQVMALLEDGLRSFHEDDYLAAAGDPGFIAAAAFLLARRGIERLQLLRWDRRTMEYLLVEIGA